jgi:hypothetical protein
MKPRIPLILNAQGQWVTKPDEPDAYEQLIHKVEAISHSVFALITPVLKAGGGFDELALRELIYKNSLDAMTRLSRDELQVLVAISIADVVLERVKRDRYGKGTNDLLG